MVRFFDLVFALLGILLLWPFALIVFIIIALGGGRPVFTQQRMGKGKQPFVLYKFRTMRIGTANVATHLADQRSITRFGQLLRKTKFDELPQLINVLRGEMSLVGPRPNLFNQTELIHEREIRGVYNHLPGITGLGQINGIDMSDPAKLANLDAEMLDHFSIKSYFYFLFATVLGKGQGDKVGMQAAS